MPWVEDYSEISFHEGDIVNFEFIKEDVHYIIHAATEASVKLNIENPIEMFDTIVMEQTESWNLLGLRM